jgi:hypothetical protein
MPLLPAIDMHRRRRDGTPQHLLRLSANRYGWTPTTIPLPDEAATPHSGLNLFSLRGPFPMGLCARPSSPVNAGSPFEDTKGTLNGTAIAGSGAQELMSLLPAIVAQVLGLEMTMRGWRWRTRPDGSDGPSER